MHDSDRSAADWHPRVFISYSHDSDNHRNLVRRFATVLREEGGVDAEIDQWNEGTRRDWAIWANRQLTEADFIIVIASPEYRKRAEGYAPAGEGAGAKFEASRILDHLTRDLPGETRRVLPVVLPGRSLGEVPSFLNAYSTTHYFVRELTKDGIGELLDTFAGVSPYPRPPLGHFTPPRSSTRSRPPETGRLLTELRNVRTGPDMRTNAAVRIDGVHYGHSIVYRPSTFASSPRGVVEYDLGRSQRWFTAMTGVVDDAVDASQAGYFQVFLDDVAKPPVETRLGKPVAVRVDVTRVLRLRLEVYRPGMVANPLLAGAMIAGGRSLNLPELAWGDPMIFD